MKAMARRLKRLEARVDLRDVADRTDEDMVLELARSLCGISKPSLRELIDCQRSDAEHQAISDQQRLALAIVSGEIEAINAVLKVGRDATSRNVKAIEEVFVRVYRVYEELCLILGDAAWSGGAGFGGIDDGDTIGELDAFDELGQLISPVQPAPEPAPGLIGGL